MSKIRVLLLGVLAAAAVAAAGCGGGGGGERLTKEEFISQADAICTEYNERFEAVEGPTSDPTSPEASDEVVAAFGDTLDELRGIFEEQIEELRELSPPEDFQAEYDRATDALESAAEKVGEAADAARAGDRDRMNALLQEVDETTEQADRIARDYGLQVCGADD